MPHNTPDRQSALRRLDGEWLRSSADVGTATGSAVGVCPRVTVATADDELLFQASVSRHVRELASRGPHGVTVAETRTSAADVDYGTPRMYWGLWFHLASPVG